MIYRFHPFALDSGTRRLLRDGQEVHLSPKAFDLLLLLVENRAQAMSKAALHERLWPSTYVTETNLAGLVAELRRALDDSAESPRYIRTMHRFGYWFTGSVEQDSGKDTLATTAAIRYWLVWETRQIPLAEGDNIIGRAQDAEVWIDAPGVSRHHARVRLDGGAVTVEDLGSKNGTTLNGHRVKAPTRLTDGSLIVLGTTVLKFRIFDSSPSTATVSSTGE